MSLLLILLLAACTPGAQSAGTGSAAAATTTIDVSLTGSTATATAYGSAAGFSPVVTTVALGTTVRFVNVDSFPHTASSFGGATFPATSPLGTGALNASGNRLSAGWSSGTLAAGTASPPLLADVAGTYLYGCFFHYSATPPMRGAIVVR
jgi:plastocyanin